MSRRYRLDMARVKVDKKEWLRLGAKYFSISGQEGIKVEQLAKKLNCNKSSFYWHFQSKNNFMQELVNYWFEHSSVPIAAKIQSKKTPEEKFFLFLKLSFEDRSAKDFMFYLRKMAKSDKQLQEFINGLTLMRLEFISFLIQELGYSKVEADMKAKILLNFYIGWYEQNKHQPSNETDKSFIIF